MKARITGTQWAVGQGGFFTGRITVEDEPVFDWVYDCGSLNKKAQFINEVDEYVQSHYPANGNPKQIDVLFISHFDWDHYNRIEVLAALAPRIKRVILPFVPLAERLQHLLHQSAPEDADDRATYVNFLISPESAIQEVFGEGTEVITVPHEETLADFPPDEEPTETVSFGPDDDVAVGISLISGPQRAFILSEKSGGSWEPFWELVMWSPLASAFTENDFLDAVVQEFQLSSRAQARSLLTDPDKIVAIIADTAKRGALRNAYAKVGKRLAGTGTPTNQTSLMVYSGPVEPRPPRQLRVYTCGGRPYIRPLRPLINPWPQRVAWLGTGDVRLSEPAATKNTIDVLGSRRLQQIGVMNLPHHGADPDYPEALLRTGRITPSALVAAVGSNNSYRHPGRRMPLNAAAIGAHFVAVTEKTLSRWHHCVTIVS